MEEQPQAGQTGRGPGGKVLMLVVLVLAAFIVLHAAHVIGAH